MATINYLDLLRYKKNFDEIAKILAHSTGNDISELFILYKMKYNIFHCSYLRIALEKEVSFFKLINLHQAENQQLELLFNEFIERCKMDKVDIDFNNSSVYNPILL